MAKEWPNVNSAVIGMGEVGFAIKKAIENKYQCIGIDKGTKLPESVRMIDYLNICIPYSNDFIEIVNKYIDTFSPKLTIIHSTVPVGTTKKIKGIAVHSPVRGNHPNLYRAVCIYKKYVGFNSDEAHKLAHDYLSKVFDTKMIRGTDETEFMKIASLTKYLGYLAITDEVADMAKKLRVDYDNVKDWEKTQNEDIDMFYSNMRWPILTPTGGKCGGHCVMPVSEMFLRECDYVGYIPKVLAQARKKYADL